MDTTYVPVEYPKWINTAAGRVLVQTPEEHAQHTEVERVAVPVPAAPAPGGASAALSTAATEILVAVQGMVASLTSRVEALERRGGPPAEEEGEAPATGRRR